MDRRTPLNYDAAEFNAVRWFAFDELPFERSDPHLRRFIEKLKAVSLRPFQTHSGEQAWR